MKKVLFLGSKPIGYMTLEHLIKSVKVYDIEIKGVLSNDNTRFGAEYSVRQLAQEYSIPFLEDLDGILEFDDIDFIISVQYHLILKQKHIDVAKSLAVNLHMAPLPEYRGCNQFSFAIYNQAKVFGTTLHRLEDGIDNGDIIAEKRFEIPEDCLVNRLYEITFEASINLFKEEIGSIFMGKYQLISQKELVDDRGTNIYFRKDIGELKSIDLNAGEDEILRRVRATAMPEFEPPFVLFKNKKYYIIPEEIHNKVKKK